MKQYITIIAILACSLQVQAQTAAKDTTLQRMLTLEREYNPTIDKASKINTLPEVKEPQAPQARIEYSNYSVPATIKPEASQVEAVQYFKDLESSNKKGYVRAGVSTFIDIDGDAGYQILNNESDELSVWLSHRSSSGKVKSLQTDEKLKLKLNDNIGALRWAHSTESLKLFSGLKYTYSGYNYYGASPSLFSVIPDQTNNIFDVNLGLLSTEGVYDVDFSLGVDYSYFTQKNALFSDENGPKENRLKLNFDLHKKFDDDKQVGVSGNLRTDFYSVPDMPDGVSDFDSYKNYGDLALNPYFKMGGSNWDMRLGFFAHLLFNQSKTFYFAPDIELNVRPYETGLLYVTVKGDVADNSNYNIFYENRYVFPEVRVLDSYTGLDGTAGFKSSLPGVFSVDFYLGYKMTSDEHFYVPVGYAYDVSYYDAKRFKIGTNLKYQYGKIFDVGLKAAYYNWNVDESDAKAWNKPNFESDLTAGFQIQSIPLRIDLAYHLETGRKSFDFNKRSVVSMKNINDVSLMETYTFNDTFSIFAKLDNLLVQKYDIWYGYPAEGIRFMGGLSFKF